MENADQNIEPTALIVVILLGKPPSTVYSIRRSYIGTIAKAFASAIIARARKFSHNLLQSQNILCNF